MGRFAGETKTIRAEWWEKEEEVVIQQISYGEGERLEYEAMEITRLPDGERLVKLNLAKRRVLRTFAGIASWTFERALSLEAVEALQPEDGEFILEAIEAFNERRTPKEQEGFRDGAGDPAAEGEAAGEAEQPGPVPVYGVELAGADGDAGVRGAGRADVDGEGGGGRGGAGGDPGGEEVKT